jgi:hypothetical protein
MMSRGRASWLARYSVAIALAVPVATGGLTAEGTGAAWAAAVPQTCTGVVAGVLAYAGGGQVAKVGTAFGDPLQAEVVDTAGCPVANEDVTFAAPSAGATGYFPGGASAVTVVTATDGVASAPPVTAGQVSGSYDIDATFSSYTVGFQLTNTTVGLASSVAISSGNGQSASVGQAFELPLAVIVTDAFGAPVAGVAVDFSVVATAGAGATFVGGVAGATAQTNEGGLATSPLLTAGSIAGAFTVTAIVSGTGLMATFSLTDVAGAPYTVTAGVGTVQSSVLGADFPVPLAVTVADAEGNAVPGAIVTFGSPDNGASGVFAGWGTRAEVTTGPDGVATAPDFSANLKTGGYVVTATVAGVATPATFALVNERRTAASAPGPAGSYWVVTGTGRVLASGTARPYGSPPAKRISGRVVGMAALPGGGGYWLVTSTGAVYAFGAAANYGSVRGKLTRPVVAMAATADGKGYWLATAGGAVLAFGDAKPYGPHAGLRLAKPIVGIAASPGGAGYWLVASDGGVFAYGGAKFEGSAGKLRLAKPIVGIAASPAGAGYWLVGSDGAVFAFGHATYFGSGLGLSPGPVKALVPTADGAGYWVVSANGTMTGFGDAGGQGSPVLRAGEVVGGAA